MARNTNPAWDTAVTAEAAWFNVDPPPGWTTNPPPNLLAASSPAGSFDSIQAFRPLIAPRGKHLFVYRDYTKAPAERLEENNQGRWWDHFLVAHILWSFTESSGAAEDVEQHLETAIAAVLARLRGPAGDHTHNGAFTSVAADADEVPTVHYPKDPLDQLAEDDGLIEVRVLYKATDHFFA